MITFIVLALVAVVGYIGWIDRASLVSDIKTEAANVEAEVTKLGAAASTDLKAAYAKLKALL